MNMSKLIEVDSPELRFPFELKKEMSCSVSLSNKTDDHVAFKVNITNPKNYCVQPNKGILFPRSTCKVVVKMRAQNEPPPDMQCKDKFLFQGAVTFAGATVEDITREMFTKESDNTVDEVKLQVVYVSRPSYLKINQSVLKFPFELKKKISCSILLCNKTDDYIAFKVKTTNQKKYCVRPNSEILSPRSTCEVIVMMQAQSEEPPDMRCKDKFLIQSIVTDSEATVKDIPHEMFTKELGNMVDEVKLQVVYVSPPKSPPLVPDGSSYWASLLDNGTATLRKFGKGLLRRRMLLFNRRINSNINFAGPMKTSTPKESKVHMFGERRWGRLYFRFSYGQIKT